MTSPSLRRTVSALSVAALFLVAGTPPALAIRNAPKETQETGTIVSIHSPVGTPEREAAGMINFYAHGGSAFVVKYPRCIVTAAHVFPESQNTNYYVVTQNDMAMPVSMSNLGTLMTKAKFMPIKKQKIAKKFKLSTRTGLNEVWIDIAVAWTENLKDTNDNKRLALDDFKPGQLAKSGDLGVPSQKKDDKRMPATMPRAMMRGYGLTGTETIMDAEGRPVLMDYGSAVKRTFQALISAYYDGRQNRNDEAGSAIRLKAIDGTGSDLMKGSPLACKNDSGSPLMLPGNDKKFYGVLSHAMAHADALPGVADAPGYCKDVAANYYSGFNATGNFGDPGNYEKTLQQIEVLCGKTLIAEKEGDGKVTGSITPAQSPSIPNISELNGGINCGGTGFDCREIVHYGQSMALTATPDAGWKFSIWKDGSEGKCPCAGSTDASCTVEEAKMGTYTETESLDVSTCKAVFVKEDPPPTCGDGNIDEGEACDGNAMDGATCDEFGYEGGSMSCNEDCTYDTEECTDPSSSSASSASSATSVSSASSDISSALSSVDPGSSASSLGISSISMSASSASIIFGYPVCGNDIVEGFEECDGGFGYDCEDLGYDSGAIYCTNACLLDFSNCAMSSSSSSSSSSLSSLAYCGNDVVDPGEECDGDVGEMACGDFDYPGGTLSCTGCAYDVSECEYPLASSSSSEGA